LESRVRTAKAVLLRRTRERERFLVRAAEFVPKLGRALVPAGQLRGVRLGAGDVGLLDDSRAAAPDGELADVPRRLPPVGEVESRARLVLDRSCARPGERCDLRPGSGRRGDSLQLSGR